MIIRDGTDSHQLEGLPEWLLIQDQIVNDPESVLTSGLRKIKPYPASRPTLRHFRNEMRRQWNRLTLDQRDEEMRIDLSEFLENIDDTGDGDCSFEHEYPATAEAVDILNSDTPSVWNRLAKSARKKFTTIVGMVRRVTLLVVENIVNWLENVRARGDPG